MKTVFKVVTCLAFNIRAACISVDLSHLNRSTYDWLCWAAVTLLLLYAVKLFHRIMFAL